MPHAKENKAKRNSSLTRTFGLRTRRRHIGHLRYDHGHRDPSDHDQVQRCDHPRIGMRDLLDRGGRRWDPSARRVEPGHHPECSLG